MDHSSTSAWLKFINSKGNIVADCIKEKIEVLKDEIVD